MGLKPSRRYAHLWQTLGGKMSERTRDLGVRIGVVLFLLFAVGACASDGDSSSTSAPSSEPVDQIVNSSGRASHTNHWNSSLGGSDWAFFADGTGAFRDAVLASSGRTFTWTKTGPNALTVAGISALSTFQSWTDISGSITSGSFTVTLNGNPTPRTFSLQQGTIIDPDGSSAGELVLTDPSNTAVRVRDKTTLVEVRTLSGGNTGLSLPTGVTVHGGRQEIFVVNSGSNSISVHAAGASGNAAPLRQIQGASTGLQFSASRQIFSTAPFNGIYVDEANGEIGVVSDAATPPAITVHSVTASGDAQPLRTIQGANTTLANPVDVAVDPTNNEIFVNDLGPSLASPQVLVFSRTASGNVAPVRTLDLSAIRTAGKVTGGFISLGGIALDVSNGELWIVGSTGGSSRPGMLVFARTATGIQPPLRSNSLNLPHYGILVDTVSGEATVLRGDFAGRILEIRSASDLIVIDSASANTEIGVALLP